VYELEPALILEAFRNIQLGKMLKSQDEAISTSYPKRRRPVDSEIDPSKSLLELIDEIRASDPEEFPAFFYHHGQKVFIKLWRDMKPSDEFDLL
jgi:methionyl-tRNA formyltransferase